MTEDARRELLERIKQMEYEGYELEAAEGTFELLVREALHPGLHFFDVESYEVDHATSAATGSPSDGDGQPEGAGRRALGHGDRPRSRERARPVPAQCLSALYPQIADVRLTDYKVRVLDSKKGTAAKVRVLVEWSDHRKSWSTVGVSENVIEASWNALVDAIRLELMRLTEQDDSVERAVEDYCWGV